MLFYFSGTGNSLYAATKLLEDTDEELINIAETVNSRHFSYELSSPDEKVGFVFPVYFYGLPSIVSWFISKLEFTNYSPGYTYAVITCGNSISGADQMLRDKLTKSGHSLDVVYTLKMPDNYVIAYELPNKMEQLEILSNAELELKKIKKLIQINNTDGYSSGSKEQLISSAAYSFYLHGRKTKKFYADETCTGCGLCATRCASTAIEIVDGKPTWVKDRCILCLGCMNRCSSIQYGKATVGRARYVHPILKK
jgi:ferredoxin